MAWFTTPASGRRGGPARPSARRRGGGGLAFELPPYPDQRRPDQRADRHGGEDRGDRPLEERQYAAIGFDQRGNERLFHHGAHHDAEHHGGDRVAVFLHDVADDPEHRDGDDAEHVVADRERTYRAAQHDDRHHGGTRRAQHVACQPDHDDAERDHD